MGAVEGASLVAEMGLGNWGVGGGSIGEIGPRRVPLKQQIPVVQCELPSLSETPPPPFWPDKGGKSWRPIGGAPELGRRGRERRRGDRVEGGGKRGGEGRASG